MVIYIENYRSIMINRQPNKKNKAKSKKSKKENKIYSVPKVIVEPKLTKEQKKEINRENNENDLYNTWIHGIKKLSKHDLGVINRPEDYPISKKDYSYNSGVQRAKDDLKLLDFLLSNLKPRYKHQITISSEFNNIIQKYLGVSEFGEDNTREEKDVVVSLASQMLINALSVIKRNMPPEFSEVLYQVGKPYFDMIEAISNFSRTNNLKNIPKITLPDGLR